MLESIRDFRQGKLQHYNFVSALEGALDASEFLDKNLVERWYDHWTPLESVRAQKGNDVTVEEVDDYLRDMGNVLKDGH